MIPLNYPLSFPIIFVAARALAAKALGCDLFASAVVSYFALMAQMGNAAADSRLYLCALDLSNGSWDVVACSHMLEHVADWRKALVELRRVLRPGGLLVRSLPIDLRLASVYEDAGVVTPEGWVEHFSQRDYLRVFGTDSAALLV